MKKILCLVLFIISSHVVFAASSEKGFISYGKTKFWVERYGQGKPTIILLNAKGQDLTSWNFVIADLSKLSSVFAYDRGDFGNSEKLQHKVSGRSAVYVVSRLRGLLSNLHVSPPYILVSSGLGSSYARYFARNYPKEIKAVILLNPDVSAAVAMGRVSDYKRGEKNTQAKFRKQYNQSIYNLRSGLIRYYKSAGRIELARNQSALYAANLEQIGAVKSERQIMTSPVLQGLPLIVLETKQATGLEQTMMKQIANSTPEGEYQSFSLSNAKGKKLLSEKIVAAVKQVLKQH